MRKLVGGDYLLDLTPIVIEQSDDENYTNITNAEVLEQLTNLKKYVKNPSMVKPVWVKFKNGETDELIVARGTFAVVDEGEFEICIIVDGYKLKLHIEFTQAELEDHTPIDDWYIDTNDAKFIFTSDYKRIIVADVKNIDGKILSQLQCGDVVIKHDESGEHSYVVTFKSETGICITYTDASCVETQSYDYVDGTGWVYNSEDKVDITNTKPIYCHPITLNGTNSGGGYRIRIAMLIFDNSNEEYNTYEKLLAKLNIIFNLNSNAVFPITGGLFNTSDNNFHIAQCINKESTNIYIQTIRSDGNNGNFNLNNFDTEYCTIYDGVNKIN